MPKLIQGGRDPTTGYDNVPCPYGLTHETINGYDYPYMVGNVCDCCRYVVRDSKGHYVHQGVAVKCRYEDEAKTL